MTSSTVPDSKKSTNNNTSDNNDNVMGFDREKLRGMAHEAGKTVREFMDKTSQQASEVKDNCQTSITANPFKAVGIAAAIGLLFGALLKRK